MRRFFSFFCVASLGLVACGDDSASGGSGGGGSSPQGGDNAGGPPSGAGNPGGAPGGRGQGGTSEEGGAPEGGGATQGGGGAGGGTGGATTVADPECAEDTDCFLSSDCCECAGRPNGEPVPACKVDCVIDQCTAFSLGLPVPAAAACVAGRCATTLTCDEGPVLCATPPPVCATGSQAIVDGICYTGDCLPFFECFEVTSCDVCTGGGVACTVNSAFQQTAHCVDDKGCASVDCGCLGPSVCVEPFTSCNEVDGHIDCGCPAC